MTKILVLGASGFIGGHIAIKALEQGWQVSGFRRDPQGVGHIGDREIDWRRGDLNDYPSLLEAMTGTDFVFHAAGSYARGGNPASVAKMVEAGTREMKHVLRAVREARVKRLIYTSSLSTIGTPPPGEDRLADERDFYQPGSMPENSYYEVKSAMEGLALEAARVGYRIVILNPTMVLGPGDVHLVTGEIPLAIARGQVPVVPPGTINIIDVRDAAQAHVNAARLGRPGERYILGGNNYPVKEAVEVFAQIAGVKGPRWTLSTGLVDFFIKAADRLPFMPNLPDHLRAYRSWQGYNTAKARRELQLSSRFLEETARDSIRWFENEGYL